MVCEAGAQAQAVAQAGFELTILPQPPESWGLLVHNNMLAKFFLLLSNKGSFQFDLGEELYSFSFIFVLFLYVLLTYKWEISPSSIYFDCISCRFALFCVL